MLENLLALAHALSDPTRVRILKLLAMRDDLCVCELVYLLPASQSRVSQNLALLKYAGLVSDTREGRWVHYALNRPAFEQALADLRWLLGASLDDLPEMAGEAQRWHMMQIDNPRRVCQTGTRDAGFAMQDAGSKTQEGRARTL